MTTLVGQLDAVQNIVADPLSAALLVIGVLLITVSLGAFGYLSLRGVLAAIVPSHGRGPPRQGE